MAWLALLWAFAMGWAWVEWVAPSRGWLERVRNIALGASAGIGLTSFLYFAWLWAGLAHPVVIAGCELAIGAPVMYLIWKRPKPAVIAAAQPWKYMWIVAVAACLALVLAGAAAVETSAAIPHGNWDAWAMWNARAKFLAGSGETWRNAVSPELFRSHPDYPLLLPSAVARAWRLGGENDPAVPRFLALLLAACVPVILISALPRPGWIGAVLLAASAGWLAEAPSQYADIPLSLYIVATLAAALIGQWEIAAMLASCAAWTKNEGLVFALAFVTGASILRKWRPALMGALPGLAVVALFKLLLAPPSEYSAVSLTKVTDPGRWGQILGTLWAELLNLGSGVSHPVLLMALLAIGLRFGPAPAGWRLCVAVAAIQSAAYIGAYLMTPANLEWQLSTSAGRLVAQIWPSVILLFTARLRTQSER